jgi:hypothetical protein
MDVAKSSASNKDDSSDLDVKPPAVSSNKLTFDFDDYAADRTNVTNELRWFDFDFPPWAQYTSDNLPKDHYNIRNKQFFTQNTVHINAYKKKYDDDILREWNDECTIYNYFCHPDTKDSIRLRISREHGFDTKEVYPIRIPMSLASRQRNRKLDYHEPIYEGTTLIPRPTTRRLFPVHLNADGSPNYDAKPKPPPIRHLRVNSDDEFINSDRDSDSDDSDQD